MVLTKSKINAVEYAKNITGMQFLILKNLPIKPMFPEGDGAGKGVFASTNQIFYNLAGSNSLKKAKVADALHSLERDGLIETKWKDSNTGEAAVFAYSRLVRITDEGIKVAFVTNHDSDSEVRALLLALNEVRDLAVAQGAVESLETLYRKIKISTFSMTQRDKSRNKTQ